MANGSDFVQCNTQKSVQASDRQGYWRRMRADFGRWGSEAASWPPGRLKLKGHGTVVSWDLRLLPAACGQA